MNGLILYAKRANRFHAVAVDPEDFDRVEAAGPWYVYACGKTHYVVRNPPAEGGAVSLHRFVMNLRRGDLEVDHVDGSGLNNCRLNLRLVTRAQQMQNRRKQAGSSRYRGVYRCKKRWIAHVQVAGTRHWLGYFDSEEEAGRVAAEARAQLGTHINEARHPAAA